MKKIVLLNLIILSHFFVAKSQHNDIFPYVYGNEVIKHTYYTIGLDPRNKVPNWVFYMLTPEMAKNLDTDIPRKDAFRTDPMTSKEFQASDADYKGSGYDRGHLCPAEDMDFNASAMLECFYYTNMAPQYPNLNRGWWRKLESQTRQWAIKDTIFVVTGVICLDNSPSIGKGITVPHYFYKIVMKKDFSEAIAFIAPNEKDCCSESLSFGIRSIDDIEKISGYDFFHGMNLEQLESTYNSIESF